MSSPGHLSELEALRSQVADLSHRLAERDRSAQQQRELSDQLRAIVEGTAAETGKEFFSALVTHLTSVRKVQYALISEVQGDHIKKIRTLAVSAGDALVDNFEYTLAHTPCAFALTQSFACFDRGLQTLFPQFTLLADLGAESYCSVPLRTKGGAVIGLLVVMDTKPLQHGDDLRSLLEVFAPRVAAELEWRRAEQERAQALVDLHNVLETIPDIVFALDTNGNVVKWNRRLEDVTGYSFAEVWNKPALAFVPPEEQARTAAAIQRVFVEGYAELEGRLLTKEHRLIPYHWTGALLRNRHGEPVGITGIGRDVSEKKRAEEELQRQQRHLVEAQMLAHLGSWYWDIDSGEVQWSDEQYRIFGYEPGSINIIYETFLAALFPADHDRVLSAIDDTLVGKSPYDIECRIVRPNGEVRFIHARGEVHRDATGHPSSMAGTVLDITERKQGEEALRLSEERFRAVFENAAVGIAVGSYTTGTGIDQVNPIFASMLGYTPEELCRLGIEGLTFSDDIPASKELVRHLVEGTRSHGAIEKRYVKKDGSLMWAHTTVSNIFDKHGHYLNSIALIQDITERKRADVALRVSEERYRALYDETPTMYFTLAMDGTVRSVNRFGAEQLGYRVEELVGHSVLGLFHEQDKEAVVASLAECLATPAITRYWEFRKIGKHGNVIWVRETTRVDLSSAEELVILVMCEDITEHKQAERESRERIRQVSAMQTALLELAHLDDTRLTFSKVLPQVTSIVADMLAVERVSLWLLSEDQTELVCQNLYLRSQATHTAGSRLATSSYPHYFSVLKESLVIAASNARVDQRTSEFSNDYFPSLGITSVLDVPICRQGKLVGVMWCEHVGAPREWAHEAQDFAASVGQTIVRMIETAERKRAEMSLRQSEERYRSLVDNAPIGIFVNKAGRFAYANRELQRILNATRAEQLLGMPVLDRIAPEFHTIVKDRVHQLAEKGQPVASVDEQYVRLDGSRIDVAVTAIPTSFDGTDVTQVLVLDIAERKQAEQEQNRLIEDLTRSRQHFQALFNWTPSAVGISTVAEGRFIDVNEGFSRLTGYMREEVVGRTTLELGLWADVSERESVLQEIRAQGYLHNREGLLRTKSGGIRSLMVSVESIQLGSTPCLIYLCHDITERKRMEDALRMRERELQAALQERERISQDLHDGILQSLFAVGLNLEVAKSLMPPKTRKTCGASLDKAIDQLNRVMREVRSFIAGLDLDLLEGKDLPTALQHALKSLTENQATRVRLAVEDRAVKAISMEQSLHLVRVIQEAVSNCIRHGRAQEATVSLKMLKQGVRLSVRDNGRGFNLHVAKGIGYGLANMAARAKRIGGRFTILSKENEGTRIVLDLPKEAIDASR
jgi:PAS domain S-box-containing protein